MSGPPPESCLACLALVSAHESMQSALSAAESCGEDECRIRDQVHTLSETLRDRLSLCERDLCPAKLQLDPDGADP